MKSKEIITRFPPSPTGPFHIGNVRTALFNYFFARKNNGKFIVRIEDTDKERSKKEYENEMLESLKWLGLEIDEVPWRQSERADIYKKYLQRLIDQGKAYISQETEGQNKEVVRFKNPNSIITFDDIVRGPMTFDTTELKDFVIARNIEEPVYHLAVVVDDFEAGVTHVIRGEDHISNTPRQILIQEAIGAPRPQYGHIPLILAQDRSKLSKRKHGPTVSLKYYREKGYSPEALINYLALLGWNPGTDKEIFTLEELIAEFDIKKVQKGGAIFDEEKLRWVNKEHLKRIPNDIVFGKIYDKIAKNSKILEKKWGIEREKLEKLLPIIFERIHLLEEVDDLINSGDFDFVFEKPTFKALDLNWRDVKDINITARHINTAIQLFESVDNDKWNADNLKKLIWDYATKEGRGQVLWPIRFSLTGKEKSPDPFTVAELLGKGETITRLSFSKNLILNG